MVVVVGVCVGGTCKKPEMQREQHIKAAKLRDIVMDYVLLPPAGDKSHYNWSTGQHPIWFQVGRSC